MGSLPQTVQTTLGFRLDPSLGGGDDDLIVGKSTERKYNLQPVEVSLVTGNEEFLTYDNVGFQFFKHNSSVQDFQDESVVKTQYYEEMANLAKNLTGATFAQCYQHVSRASKMEGVQATGFGVAHALHVDYNYAGSPEYFQTLPERPEKWDELQKHRWAVFSMWRPTSKVTRDALCMADKRTVPDSDLINGSTDMDAPGRMKKLGLFWVNYSPQQRYYSKPNMDASDLILIKLFDTKKDGRARCTPHTAYQTSGDHGGPRRSIEVRCLVVWEDEAPE